MKLSAFALLSLTLAPTETNGFLFGLIDGITDRLVAGVCERAEKAIDENGDVADCTCDGSFSLFGGLRAVVNCESNDRVCLQGTQYCGFSDVDASLSARGLIRTDSGFVETSIAIDIDTNVPNLLGNTTDLPALVMEAIPVAKPSFGFGSCTVSIGDEKCDECEVCEDGKSFTFDCANVDMLDDDPDLITIPGPAVNECVTFMLVKYKF